MKYLLMSIMLISMNSFAAEVEDANVMHSKLTVGVLSAEYTHTAMRRTSIENLPMPGSNQSGGYTYFEMPERMYTYVLNGNKIQFNIALTGKKSSELMPLLHSGKSLCVILKGPRPKEDYLQGYYDIVDYSENVDCPVTQ